MKMKNLIASFGLALASLSGYSQANVVFSDNFNAENGGVGTLNYGGFNNWSVSNGTVDLIGNGFFDFQPGYGLYVDLDGSSANAGIMSHSQNLMAGNYTLYFDLAGNHRNMAPESTAIDIILTAGNVNLASLTVSLGMNDPFQTYSLSFNVPSPAAVNLDFAANSNDNIGMLLDNVWLDHKKQNLPEPSGLLLIGLGLLSVGLVRKHQA